MVELVEWLRAQLDEDERIARAIPLDLGHGWSDPGPWVMAGNGGGGREAEVAKAADGLEMPLAEHVAHHIAEHDPARVLREIDAKRQLLDEHQDVNDGSCGTCVDGSWGYPTHGGSSPQRLPCRTLRLLALPYADRPGYQESWRP